MPIKEIIKRLAELENQDAQVFQIIVDIYSNNIVIYFDDARKIIEL